MKILISAVALFFGLTMVGVEAEAAKRLGGGKSMGAQRSMTQQQATPKAPAQQQQAGAPAQQPAAAPAQTGNKWLGPLAGLAMGAGLMALFMNNGISGALSGLLLAAAIAAVALLAFRAWRGRAAQAPMQYARDSTALADFLAADLLAEVQAQWQSEGAAQGKTDVVTLESEVLEVVSEGLLHVASVRFSGLIREDGASEPQPFAEIWHLEKPMRGSTGWLVSGIQQA